MFLEIYNLFRMEMISGTISGYFLQAVPITIVVGILYAVCRLVFLKHRNCHIGWLWETMGVVGGGVGAGVGGEGVAALADVLGYDFGGVGIGGGIEGCDHAV